MLHSILPIGSVTFGIVLFFIFFGDISCLAVQYVLQSQREEPSLTGVF
jgi:1,4-dihydroxy-2-naphthoate octaprenyltransferase